jgi:hypothetical protein
VISLLHVDALVMSLQICLSYKLLVAVIEWAREWIFSTGVVCLHMRLEVVTAPEEFPTTFNVALEVGVFFGGELSNSCPNWTSSVVE